MIWQPKPRNWRTFYGYRPSRWLAWLASDHNRAIDDDYLRWLCKHRGFATAAEARKHVDATQKPCGLIRADMAPEPEFWVAPKAKADPVSRIVAMIRKLPMAALEAVQSAIDERLAA